MLKRLWIGHFCFTIVFCCFISGCFGSLVNENQGTFPCTTKQFTCANKKCIPIPFLCDGDNDCDDGSDESIHQCSTNNVTCAENEFRCKSGRCIPIHWQCDNDEDCSDGSDEDEHTCQQRVCGVDEFTCRSAPGECVPLTWMCDDNPDCSDGSDEKTCNETCRSDEFTCKNGKCIQKRWICDADNDCGDNSDEQNCPPIKCNESEFQCSENFCISNKWRCDGVNDCANGKDEQNCTKSSIRTSFCLPEEYECSDHLTCIHRSWLCDGTRDCPDGSDESPDHCRNATCRPDQFQCRDGACVPGRRLCNGQRDCADASDELNCDPPARAPPACDAATQFDCGAGACIPLAHVCDGRRHCPAGEDEPAGRCGVDECATANGGCSHACVDTPASFRCACPAGYALAADARTCRDVDECERPEACSQVCINEKGGFKCDCERGYMRDPRNLTRCKAIEGHASLLFARRHDIRKISLDHHEMTSIVNETNSATALDFVFRTGMIFWSDVTDKRIYKAPIDEGTDRRVVVSNDITTSDGLAVDWIYNHIYWTDTEKNTIELANFDGKMRKVLVRDRLEEPRALALNPMDGWMFWTDWGSEPKIERSGMDGSHRQVIVSYDVKWPNGLTLDLVKKRVYWVDAKLNVISSCDYNGRNRRVILYSPESLRHPFSITTFEDWIYWTDWDKAAVFKANKFTGADVQPVTATEMIPNPMVIHVYHPYRQPDGENYCQAVNGHCSHLCLPAPQINQRSPRISCACPENLRMLEDGLTCVQDETITTTTYSVAYSTDMTTMSNIITERSINKTHIPNIISENSDDGKIAMLAILIIIVIVGVLSGVAYFIYRKYLKRNMTSMNFDNPVYRKTTEDQFSLEKNQFQTTRPYLSTVGEEAQQPLTGTSPNECV